MLRVTDLNIFYESSKRRKELTRNLNIEIATGTTCMLAGRNGSGKSSLLRCLSGLQRAESGEVEIDGKSVGDSTENELASMVSIMFSMPPNLELTTVTEVLLTAMQRHFSPWKTEFASETARAVDCLDLCGMADFKARYFQSLSDGEKQKVMLARSLAQETPVLLLDEPLAFLDYPSRQEMLRLLRKLAETEGKTIVFSSHDLDISMNYCDSLLLLKNEGDWEFINEREVIRRLQPTELFM